MISVILAPVVLAPHDHHSVSVLRGGPSGVTVQTTSRSSSSTIHNAGAATTTTT